MLLQLEYVEENYTEKGRMKHTNPFQQIASKLPILYPGRPLQQLLSSNFLAFQHWPLKVF